MEAESTTLVGQFLLFLTTVIGFGIQMYRESRNRKWDLEDRKNARREMESKVESVKQETVAAHEVVVRKIEENTELSRTAFSEANNVNKKFLALANAINATYDRKAAGIRERESDFAHAVATVEATKESVDEAKAVAEDTNLTVHAIEKKLE